MDRKKEVFSGPEIEDFEAVHRAAGVRRRQFWVILGPKNNHFLDPKWPKIAAAT